MRVAAYGEIDVINSTNCNLTVNKRANLPVYFCPLQSGNVTGSQGARAQGLKGSRAPRVQGLPDCKGSRAPRSNGP